MTPSMIPIPVVVIAMITSTFVDFLKKMRIKKLSLFQFFNNLFDSFVKRKEVVFDNF